MGDPAKVIVLNDVEHEQLEGAATEDGAALTLFAHRAGVRDWCRQQSRRSVSFGLPANGLEMAQLLCR